MNYLVDLVATYWLWVPVLAVAATAVLLLHRARWTTTVVALALPVAGALHALYIVKSGGDYLTAPVDAGVFALLAPLAAVPWHKRLIAPAAVLGVWALLAIVLLRPSIHEAFVPLTEHGVVEGRVLMENLTKPGHRPVLADDFIFTDGPLAKRLQKRASAPW